MRLLSSALLYAFSLAAAANPWEADIRAFEAADRKSPPAQGGIVFVGSSSIVKWDLPAAFPGLPAINRGFGGSQLADAVAYARRVVVTYRPKTVVLYAGDNDIAAGKAPEQVASDYRSFVAVVRAKLPACRIVFLSIKPSRARWTMWGAMQRANALVREAVNADPAHLRYVEVGTPLLGPDGTPDPKLFEADGLHLNAAGYAKWAAILRPALRGKGS